MELVLQSSHKAKEVKAKVNEQQIAEQQKQNVPAPVSAVVAPVGPPQPQDTSTPLEIELNELTQYKLRGYFGLYEADESDKAHMKFVYEHIAQRIGTTEYSQVVNTMRSIEAMIGATHDQRRLYKLYQWLKLDNQRTRIENEMQVL